MIYNKERALEIIERDREDITQLCEFIYENPEKGFQEFKSSEALKQFLEGHGFKVEMGIADLPTAFRAVKEGRGEGPAVCFICEYDALPNGHSCGHNIIGTAGATAAAAAAEAMGEFEGKIIVMGTPSEEGSGGGKELLYRAGYFDGVDCVMMFHPNSFTVINDKLLAIAAYSFTFHGKPAHAGAYPEQGISALEAVIQLFNNVNGMRSTVKGNTRIHGIIKKGGEVTNVIPHLSEAQFGIRAVTMEELEVLTERVKNCARAAALSTGCTVDIEEIGLPYADLISNETLLELVEKNMKALGEKIDVRDAKEGLGSSDIGNLSHHIPAFQVMLGMNCQAPPHTDAFAQACKGREGAEAAIRAAKAMAMTGIDIFNNPEVVDKAKEELKGKLNER